MRIVFIIILVFLAFALFIVGGQWLLDNRLAQIMDILPEEQRPLVQSLLDAKEGIAQKVFRSQDNRLEVTYPSTWIPIPNSGGQEALLRVGRFTEQGAAAQLIVNKVASEEEALEQILEDMKTTNAKQGWSMETTNEAIGETEATFDSRYTNEESQEVLLAKEKILVVLDEDGKQVKTYTIAVLGDESTFKEFEREAVDILAATKLVL